MSRLFRRFFVLDGPDGAGKSTQLALLAGHLRAAGVDLCLTRDPGGTAIGDRIRAILLDRDHGEMAVACEMLLYMASRAQLVSEVIRPALSRGQCVLCDRWGSATLAYQGAGGADEAAILQAAELAIGPTRPDLTVILDIPSEDGLARAGRTDGGLDRMECKHLDFHRRVRASFLRQAQANPAHMLVVDARGAVDEVQGRLRSAMETWLAKAPPPPEGPPC